MYSFPGIVVEVWLPLMVLLYPATAELAGPFSAFFCFLFTVSVFYSCWLLFADACRRSFDVVCCCPEADAAPSLEPPRALSLARRSMVAWLLCRSLAAYCGPWALLRFFLEFIEEREAAGLCSGGSAVPAECWVYYQFCRSILTSAPDPGCYYCELPHENSGLNLFFSFAAF